VKYIIMLFGDQASMLESRSIEWIKSMIQFMHQINADLLDAGELVAADGLADPTRAKTVRWQGGLPVATDGPFAESRESLAGYFIVDVENEARAIAIASRIVAFIEQPVEVRQIMNEPPSFDD
jgi:hypothetical protein